MVVALAGCATPDERPPLEECRYARYWADCGGNEPDADPVVGCDPATGECRWFFGGETARGYVVSDCPVEEMCCHEESPFTDWFPPLPGATPDLEAGDVTRMDLGLFGLEGVIGPSRTGDLPVVTDYLGALDEVRSECSGPVPLGIPCGGTVLYSRVEDVGDAIVVSFTWGGRGMLQIEIYPTEGPARHARVYELRWRVSIDPDPEERLCNLTGWFGNIVPIDSGTLHVNAVGLTDPTQLHGLLEGPNFTIEF